MVSLRSEGKAGERLRRRRDRGEPLPWGSLERTRLSDAVVAEAQRSFSDGARSEYMTAIGFSELARALVEASAPIDLVGLASDFVADEVLHADLNARLALELGAEPPSFRVARPTFGVAADTEPLDRALSLAVRISCVGEALSVPLLALAARTATHPLVRGVLRRIVRDEAPHAELGLLVLAWARGSMDEARVARLRAVLVTELARFADYFAPRASLDPTYAEEFESMGIARPADYERVVTKALQDRVLVPLARFGIEVDTAEWERG